jgi:hypothetical protein
MAGAGERPTLLISDITGVTGMSILRAIVAGERDCLKLAQMKHPPNQEQHPRDCQSLGGRLYQGASLCPADRTGTLRQLSVQNHGV